MYFISGTWKPRIALDVNLRQRVVRQANGGAGLGGRKKRMPCCNGADTGFNVTRHESEPTFDWSFFAR
ncbi:MAG: hypothetical protein HRT37_23910 [Alteromonadaceae bacterium]|nr:hypothetical protein [Alteromonadaceae bacterium]